MDKTKEQLKKEYLNATKIFFVLRYNKNKTPEEIEEYYNICEKMGRLQKKLVEMKCPYNVLTNKFENINGGK